ncbi:MAG: NADH-quinone oxidoreductase subunit J [Angustibacter sp.]
MPGLLVQATTSPGPTGPETVMFWILAPLMVVAAAGLLFARKAVHAALGMAIVMVSLGGMYLVQDADFLGVIQVFVYTGAVMMLFLFVLMLIGVDSADSLRETIGGQRWIGATLVAGLAGLLIAGIGSTQFGSPRGMNEANADGNVVGIAGLIFGRYVWAFEVTSALLITAAMGAMILAHRERIGPKRTQKLQAAERVKSGLHVAGLPAPGVFARHNAVDTPALLPDGTPSELSVSRVLRARAQVRTEDGSAPIAAIDQEIKDGDRR